jgi:F-box-like
MHPSCQRTLLLNLSTELLVQILSYLPAVDLFAVQRICREIRHIVAGTTYLQYILRTQINGVDDFLPPNLPYSERLKLLRRHEESWNGLEFDLFAEFTTSVPQPNCYTLRDGYLIYEDLSGTTLRYGYTDLCSATRNEDLSWYRVTLYDIHFPLPSKVVFAVDHDLVVAMRFFVLS